MTEFIVYDALCGSGKTNRIKDLMYAERCSEKFLYITPFLSECHRIAATTATDEGACKYNDTTGGVEYKQDDRMKDLMFCHPDKKKGFGKKEQSLATLLKGRRNIVSTHQLFRHMSIDSLDGAEDYTLIIDEALTVFEETKEIGKREITKLKALGILYLASDGITLKFDRGEFGIEYPAGGEDKVKDTPFESLAMMCDLDQLLLIDGKTIVWEMSTQMLSKFKRVIICTYLFEGQLFASYLKKNGIEYRLIRFGKKGSDCKDLIEVLDDKHLNMCGSVYHDLSASYFDGRFKIPARDMFRKHLNTVMFRWKAKTSDRMFTCFKDDKADIANSRYIRNWIPFNACAVNDFSAIHHVAYLVNVFPPPTLVKAAKGKETEFDEDIYSLSCLVQFVFRSAIRNGEPIKLYLPSLRMRTLLFKFLDGEYDMINLEGFK